MLATATGLSQLVSGKSWGRVFWGMTLFCGFLTLAPSMASTIDGIVRRWVDVFWTSSRRLRALDPESIRTVYFRVLVGYAILGLVMLWANGPTI